MSVFIEDGSMNELEIETLKKFLELTKHGAKTIDINVRKDGKEYTFQADFLKHMKIVGGHFKIVPLKPTISQVCAVDLYNPNPEHAEVYEKMVSSYNGGLLS